MNVNRNTDIVRYKCGVTLEHDLSPPLRAPVPLRGGGTPSSFHLLESLSSSLPTSFMAESRLLPSRRRCS